MYTYILLKKPTHTNKKGQKTLAYCFKCVYIAFYNERDNSSKIKYTANNSTPLIRAFFIRSTHTPKKRYNIAVLSMVACSGKGLALCCVPCIAVCHPVARYRQITVTSEAIAPINFYTELSAMIYKFLLLGKKRLTIRIRANSEAEARQRLQLSNNALCIARFSDNLTACNQVKGGVYA